MLFFNRPENPPVGLEINPGGVRMLQVLPSDDGSPAVAVSQRPLPA